VKAIAIPKDRTYPELIDVPKPNPEEGEALVRTLRVGIDGTDYEVIKGSHGGFPDDSDYHILGHEAVGIVEESNRAGLEPGDIVVPTVRRPPGESNEYFDRGIPDMAPEGSYVERGITGSHGFMSEYFTSPGEFLVEIPRKFHRTGFLIEPISNSEKAIEHAIASRSAFDWQPESALVLGNGPLGLLTLAMLEPEFERVYCLGRRDRPDPTINIIEQLGATYIDSRETPVDTLPTTHESMDLVYEATGFAKHPYETVDALSPNGVGVLLGIPEDCQFEIDGGKIHRQLVLGNKALLGSVNSSVPHFEDARESLATFSDWFCDALITDVFQPSDIDQAFSKDEKEIKTVIEFDTL
jgi:threonine dehydrogenase-like Zn-dependent dehydrogenase